MTTDLRVADASELDRTLRSMARHLRGEVAEPTGLVGIRRRGVPLAERLAHHLGKLHRTVPVGELGMKRYDDDLNVLHDEPSLEELPLPFDLDGARVVVVDDVLFTGRTLMRAASHLLARGAGGVELAVLCSRGRPEVPVAATRVGMRLDVPDGLVVEVHIPPYEDDTGILIRRVDG